MEPPVSSSPPSGSATRSPAAAALERRLALLQGVTFAVIACAAISAFATAAPGSDAAPPRAWTMAGVAMAVGAVLLRRFSTSPVMQAKTRVALGVAALVLAGGVAVCGAGIAWEGGPRQPALAFALGAAILALRRPSLASASPAR